MKFVIKDKNNQMILFLTENKEYRKKYLREIDQLKSENGEDGKGQHMWFKSNVYVFSP